MWWRSFSVMPATGSSSSSRRGFWTSTIAISSHCFCPCDSEPAWSSCCALRLTASRISAHLGDTPLRRLSSERNGSRKRGREVDVLEQVSSSKTDGVWNVRPMPMRTIVCSVRPTSSSPANLIEPLVGRTRLVITSISVVLPAPLGPITKRSSCS